MIDLISKFENTKIWGKYTQCKKKITKLLIFVMNSLIIVKNFSDEYNGLQLT